MSRTQRRLARKDHRCDSCRGRIEAGHVYLIHTLFPGNDIRDITHPDQGKECADCAIRYGRHWDLEPVPDTQPYRYWLGDVAPDFDSPFGSDR